MCTASVEVLLFTKLYRITFSYSMVTTSSQKVNSVKVFPFSSQMWCDCKQQPHLQSLFHQLLNDESTCVFSLWWLLMEESSSSSIQTFQSVVARKMFILHGCKGEGATEQHISWILIFFFYPFNLLYEGISVICWEQVLLGSHGQGRVKDTCVIHFWWDAWCCQVRFCVPVMWSESIVHHYSS